MSFTTLQSVPAKNPFPGITGHYAHLEHLTFGEVDLVAGTLLPVHQHPHEQVTYVISGRLEFTVGAETRLLEPGMCAISPGATPHSGRALTACRAIDVFSPVREDYR